MGDLLLPIENLLDKLVLETELDLSQYPAYKSINLSEHYVFTNTSKFCSVVAVDGVYMLYLLAFMMAYNILTHNKVTTEYAK